MRRAPGWLHHRACRTASKRVTNPQISVVIPTFQRREIVRATVQSLAFQERPCAFEVIVVVDGSTDGTADALRGLALPFELTIIEQSNEGASSARNTGAHRARADVILFLDDDMEAHSQLLDQHIRSHHGGAEVVLGHFPLHPNAPASLLTQLVHEWVETRLGYLTDGASRELSERHLYDFHVAQMSVRREAFTAVGGFSSTFTSGGAFGNEDYDLGYRLLGAGYRIVFNRDAITWQNYDVSPLAYLKRARQAGRADVAFARRYPEQREKLFELRRIRRRIHPILQYPGEVSWLSAIVRVALRSVAVMLFPWAHRPGRFGRRIKALFFQVETLEYWTGVRDAGDIPAQHHVRVLCYSHVVDSSRSEIGERSVSVPRFREQLSMLRRAGYHFIDAREFIALIGGGGKVPANPVLVTMDNGLESIGAALPTLREFHVPAVAFVSTREIAAGAASNSGIAGVSPAPVDVAPLTALAASEIEAGCQLPTEGAGSHFGDTALRAEIRAGITFLKQIGITVRLLAYARGEEHDGGIHKAAAAEGIQAAFTRTPWLVSAGDNRYQLGRLEVRQSDRGRRFLDRLGSMRLPPPSSSEARSRPDIVSDDRAAHT